MLILQLEAGEVVEADARHVVVKNKEGRRKNITGNEFPKTNDFSAFYIVLQ
jgi:transcriptional antiterminator Rof (Rho-off)